MEIRFIGIVCIIFTLVIAACSQDNSDVQKKPAVIQPEKPKVQYVTETEVKQDLDCGANLTAEVRDQNMRLKYKDKRIKFNGKILRIEGMEIRIFGMLGTGIFSGTPLLYAKNDRVIKDNLLLEDNNYKFDCRIVDSCKDGLFSNSLIFEDCIVIK